MPCCGAAALQIHVSVSSIARIPLTVPHSVEKIARPQFADCGRPLALTYRSVPLERAYRPAPAFIQVILRQHTTCVASEPAPRHPVELNTDDAGHVLHGMGSLAGMCSFERIEPASSGYRTPPLVCDRCAARRGRLCGVSARQSLPHADCLTGLAPVPNLSGRAGYESL
jgi:hypothetical protein